MQSQFWQQLESACEGLLYPSETDAPVEPVRLTPPFPWDDPALPRREQPVHDFFDELTGSPDAAGFHALYGLLAGSLSDLRVHRVGEVRVGVFVTGVPAGSVGERVGVKTLSVET